MKREDTPMWSDPEEPSYVRDLLDAGRNAPAEYDVARGLAAHLAHVQAGTPLPHWAKAGASGGGMATGTLVTWIAVPVITASVIASVYLASKDDPKPSVASAPAPVSAPMAPVAPVAPVAEAPTKLDAPALPAPTTSVLPVEGEAPTQKRARLERAKASPSAARADHAAKVVPSTTTTPSATAAPASAAAAPRVATPHQAHPVESDVVERMMAASRQERAAETAQSKQAAEARPQLGKTAGENHAVLDDTRLEREMRMLAVAQRILSEDPERALRMAEQGEREFPGTMFSAERRQVALLAMVKLGRVDEARRIGKPFLAKYPNAPWSARLRRALATGRVE